MSKYFNMVIGHVAKKVGLSVTDIRNYSPDEMREHLEKKSGKKLLFVSEFPTIGRGNVLRNGIVTKESLNNEIDLIISEIRE
ncbi:MAG: hypothetical protein IJ608_14490 [Lachnospiraceae bacterium]|nr:hypothetical protein [Lachnospiraceae bacterium]